MRYTSKKQFSWLLWKKTEFLNVWRNNNIRKGRWNISLSLDRCKRRSLSIVSHEMHNKTAAEIIDLTNSSQTQKETYSCTRCPKKLEKHEEWWRLDGWIYSPDGSLKETFPGRTTERLCVSENDYLSQSITEKCHKISIAMLAMRSSWTFRERTRPSSRW